MRMISKACVALVGRKPYYRLEVRLEDRLEDDLRRHLHHAIPHRRNAQRPLPPVWFGNVPPPHRLRPIRPARRSGLQFPKKLRHALLLDHRQRQAVDAGRTLVARTRSHASSRTSLRQIRSYSAWKRRSRLHLAAMYRRRWSCRTFPAGCWVLRPCPRAYLHTPHDQSRAPSLDRPSVAGVIGTMNPSDSRPARFPFRHRLIGTAFARRGPPGRVSPVPHQTVFACPPPYPAGVLHRSGLHGQSVAFAVT